MNNLALKQFRDNVVMKMTKEEKESRMEATVKEIKEFNIDSEYFHKQLDKLRGRM